ncbi:MAG: epimerase, partial [Nocardioidaceae bacterium]|nr:epimerase [Nocardioidaceae bacterium]
MKILVTGASGYVGSRLVPRLLADGHDVRISVTHPPDPDELWWLDRVEVAEMDALEPAQVDRAVAGTDAVYFLIHGMSDSAFATKDRTAATLMAAAVTAHHVERVVYLSGLVPRVPETDLSEHIASRLEVERLLSTSDATVVALRAAILVGAASTSFEIVRQVSARLAIQTIP